MIKRICEVAQRATSLHSFSLNLENRIGIDSEGFLFVKDLIMNKKSLKFINISFVGTGVDVLLANNLNKIISRREDLEFGRILF